MIIFKILSKIAAVLGSLWVLTMVVYFFNLDMKLTAAIYPLLEKYYDRIKRDKHL